MEHNPNFPKNTEYLRLEVNSDVVLFAEGIEVGRLVVTRSSLSFKGDNIEESARVFAEVLGPYWLKAIGRDK